MGLYGIGFWLPTIVQESLGIAGDLDITLLTAAPYAVGAVAMVLIGRYVRPGRRAPGHVTTVRDGRAAAWPSLAPRSPRPSRGSARRAVRLRGRRDGLLRGFWRLPTAFLSGAAAAAGIAVVNSIGNLAGFAGPYWVGFLTETLGAAKWGLVSIGLVMVAGALAVLALSREHERRT